MFKVMVDAMLTFVTFVVAILFIIGATISIGYILYVLLIDPLISIFKGEDPFRGMRPPFR